MASPHSEDSNTVDVLDFDEHIKKVNAAIDTAMHLSKILYEERGKGALKPGKKLAFGATNYGIEDLKSMISSIKTNVRMFKKIVRNNEKAAKDKRKNRQGDRKIRNKPVHLYTPELVKFFNDADLGTGPDGVKRLQDSPDMAHFFQSGVGNLTFGVSLFNVLGNRHKLVSNTKKVFLDAKARTALSGALSTLKQKKIEKLNASESEKEREGRTKDLERLDAGELQNKDYMTILSFYRTKIDENDTKTLETLKAYEGVVADMSKITHDLNDRYGEQLKERDGALPKQDKKVAEAPAPAPGKLSLPTPAVPARGPSVPVAPIPTVARGASPVTRHK